MKKNLFIILFSMMAMSGAYFLFSTSVEAGECARTGTKINIDRQSVAVNEYTVNGDEAGYGQTNCVEEPLYYKVSIYKVLFCTADPYVSNDNPDFKSCIGTIFETTLTTGKEIIIQSGVPSDLIDNSIILPIGSYSYAAIIVDNHLGLKHTETFIEKGGSAINMRGAVADGPVCWTRDGKATAFSGPTAGSHISGLHPGGLDFTVTSATTSGRASNTLDCGTALPADWATVDKYYSYEIIDSISDTCDENSNCDSTFGAYIDYDTADDLGVGGLAASLLLKADGLTKATARANAVKIGYFINFTTPKLITESTTGLQINFTTSTSVSVDTGKDGTSDVQVYALKVGADPFGVRFRTKNRRSRGTWR